MGPPFHEEDGPISSGIRTSASIGSISPPSGAPAAEDAGGCRRPDREVKPGTLDKWGSATMFARECPKLVHAGSPLGAEVRAVAIRL